MKRLTGYQFLKVPIQMAIATQSPLNTLQPTLPFLSPRLVAKAKVQDEQVTSRLQKTNHFCQIKVDLLNATVGKCANNGIE